MERAISACGMQSYGYHDPTVVGYYFVTQTYIDVKKKTNNERKSIYRLVAPSFCA